MLSPLCSPVAFIYNDVLFTEVQLSALVTTVVGVVSLLRPLATADARLTPKARRPQHLYERSVSLGTDIRFCCTAPASTIDPHILPHSDRIRPPSLPVPPLYIYMYTREWVRQECGAFSATTSCVFIISAAHMAHVCTTVISASPFVTRPSPVVALLLQQPLVPFYNKISAPVPPYRPLRTRAKNHPSRWSFLGSDIAAAAARTAAAATASTTTACPSRRHGCSPFTVIFPESGGSNAP